MFRIRFHFTLILKNFIYSLFVQYLFFNFLSFSEYMPTTKSFYEIIFFFRKIYQSQQEHLQSNPYIATNNIIHSSMSHHTYYNFSFTLGSFVAVCVCGGILLTDLYVFIVILFCFSFLRTGVEILPLFLSDILTFITLFLLSRYTKSP